MKVNSEEDEYEDEGKKEVAGTVNGKSDTRFSPFLFFFYPLKEERKKKCLKQKVDVKLFSCDNSTIYIALITFDVLEFNLPLNYSGAISFFIFGVH